jgi:hypothetical protein
MNEEGYFVITRVHRDDLEAAGFDTSNVTDSQMEYLAKKMADDYLSQLFWSSLEIIAEDVLKIPKKNIPIDNGDAICVELSDGTEVELCDSSITSDGVTREVVSIYDTENNELLGYYDGHLPSYDEDYDIDELIEKVEKAIKEGV